MKNLEKPNIVEIIWLFVIGCFLGFILETLWHYFKYNLWINKQGLLYGPFKPIYGFGLIIIILTMYRFQNKNILIRFGIGVIVGSAFEYFGSIFQEFVFGTETWNYSNFNYNISGRIYLPYCLAWGFIALICLKFYPKLKQLISKINLRLKIIVTIIISVFMIINLTLTTFATLRYSARSRNQSTNAIFKLIDELYSDEYMYDKFPKLKIIKK